MGVRKSFTELTTTQRDDFLEALLTLKQKIANPTAPAAEQVSIYDQFVAMHRSVMSLTMPSGTVRNFGHGNSMFLPWHRLYIKELESELQEVNPSVTLPYWDWPERAETGSKLFQDDFMGPTFNQLSIVTSGYFAQNAPDPLPAWWPTGLSGWFIRSEVQPYLNALPQDLDGSLVRLGGATNDLANQSVINEVLAQTDYHSFRLALEAGITSGPDRLPTHNFGHNWVGGHMGTGTSPNDPIFFMHHCYIDKLWADWQDDGHQNDYSGSSPYSLNDPMWPWVTNPEDYNTPPLLKDLLPTYEVDKDFTPEDVMDISDPLLDYSYE